MVDIGIMLKELASIVDTAVLKERGGKLLAFHQRTEPEVKAETSAATATNVRALIDARKARARHFPKNWFSDPAWDILLILYEAYLAGHSVTVGEISASTGLCPTTTIRWLDIIEHQHLVTRQRCKIDTRRVFIRLDASGIAAMNDYFGNLVNRHGAANSQRCAG